MGKRIYLTESQFKSLICEAKMQVLIREATEANDFQGIKQAAKRALKKGLQVAAVIAALSAHISLSNSEKEELKKELEKEEYAIKHSGIYNEKGEEMIDYDKTLAGKLINYSENRDSIGYDKEKDRWYAPPRGKKYDRHQRGMGVDVNTNPFVKKYLRADNKGSYLSGEDEKKVRYMSMERAEKSYERRLAHAQDALQCYETPSEKKKAITMSAIYNLGEGFVARRMFEDKNLMDLLLNGTDEEYKAAVDKYYKLKRKGQRPKREQEFFDKETTPPQA